MSGRTVLGRQSSRCSVRLHARNRRDYALPALGRAGRPTGGIRMLRPGCRERSARLAVLQRVLDQREPRRGEDDRAQENRFCPQTVAARVKPSVRGVYRLVADGGERHVQLRDGFMADGADKQQTDRRERAFLAAWPQGLYGFHPEGRLASRAAWTGRKRERGEPGCRYSSRTVTLIRAVTQDCPLIHLQARSTLSCALPTGSRRQAASPHRLTVLGWKLQAIAPRREPRSRARHGCCGRTMRAGK